MFSQIPLPAFLCCNYSSNGKQPLCTCSVVHYIGSVRTSKHTPALRETPMKEDVVLLESYLVFFMILILLGQRVSTYGFPSVLTVFTLGACPGISIQTRN